MSYLGIDIGGTAAKLGMVDGAGRIIREDSCDVSFDRYDTPILTTVIKKLDEFAAANRINIRELEGIGVSATGQIDTGSGTVIGSAGHIKNWEGTRIKEELESRYAVKTTVVNDANCVAIAEHWIGKARGAVNALVITIGTGVGGGIISDSKILLGSKGVAGEIGHFVLDCHGRPCSCGNRGCYEQYASMTALVNTVKQQKQLLEKYQLDEAEVNGKRIFELASEGAAPILEIVEEWIDFIACGLVGLTHIFAPEIILIGGAVSRQQELFIDKLRRKVLAGVMPVFRSTTRLEAAALGNNAGLVGAVCYCMKH
jgi:glucokinase